MDLRNFRESKNLTQTQLAEKVGVSRSIIAKIENGNIEISNNILEKIKAIFPDFNTNEDGNYTLESGNFRVKLHRKELLSRLIDTFIEDIAEMEYVLSNIKKVKSIFSTLGHQEDLHVLNYEPLVNEAKELFAQLVVYNATEKITLQTLNSQSFGNKLKLERIIDAVDPEKHYTEMQNINKAVLQAMKQALSSMLDMLNQLAKTFA